MQNELVALFRRNFPFIVREEETARRILEHKECKIIEKRNEQKASIWLPSEQSI